MKKISKTYVLMVLILLLGLTKAGISQDNIRRWEILNAEKVIVKVNNKIPYTVRMNYAEWIVDETSKYDRVSTALVLGLIAQESRFRDSVNSHVGARGLGQVMPPTAGDICEHLKIPYVDGIEYNAKTNIQMTTWYLNRMILYYNSVSKALAHYNGGQLEEGICMNTYGDKVLEMYKKNLTECMSVWNIVKTQSWRISTSN